jgi:hypothetical protein
MSDNLPEISVANGEIDLWKLKSGEWHLSVHDFDGHACVELSKEAAGELIRQLLQVRLQLGEYNET